MGGINLDTGMVGKHGNRRTYQRKRQMQTYFQVIMTVLMVLVITSLILMTRSQLNTKTTVMKMMTKISENLNIVSKPEKSDERIEKQIRKDWNCFNLKQVL